MLLMTPNEGLPNCATRPGWPKFVWLKRSKNSARNSMIFSSLSRVFLTTEKSVLLKAGPMTALRPRLPKWKTLAPLMGMAKAAPAGSARPSGGA